MNKEKLSIKEKKLIVELRKNKTQNIIGISKEKKIPKSTLYDIMHNLRKTEVLRQITKISFKKIGYPITIFFVIKIDLQYRDKLKQFLLSQKNVNNIHVINNISSFHIECIFRNQKDAEEFLEKLENQTPLIQLSTYNLLETIQEEKFLTEEAHFE
jgi:DNA-binding Lrp family transcriptional regulator